MIVTTILILFPTLGHASDHIVVMPPPGPYSDDPISQSNFITVVIESIQGDRVIMRAQNNVTSRYGKNQIHAGELITGVVTSWATKIGQTRVPICVDSIGVPNIARMNFYRKKIFPHEGCFGQLHDAVGTAGMPIQYFKPGSRGHVYLNGDLHTNTETVR